jgi:hypothetical protein
LELTDAQQDILFRASVLAREGKGQAGGRSRDVAQARKRYAFVRVIRPGRRASPPRDRSILGRGLQPGTVKRRPHPNRGQSPGNFDEGQDPRARRKNGPTGVNMSAAGGTTHAGAGFPDTPATPFNPATHAVSLGFPAPSGFRTPRRPEGLVVARPSTGPDSRTPLRRPSNPARHAVSFGFPAPHADATPGSRSCALEHSS